jgi:predicted AlkP superfamily pyrophosphatase or phosphodiesterase
MSSSGWFGVNEQSPMRTSGSTQMPIRVLRIVLIPLIALAALSLHAADAKYILFLTADGFRSDYIEWYEPAHLKRLIAEGTRVTSATPVFPTVTTPNMTSLVTGAFPRTTGIACNSQYVREEDKIVRSPRNNAAETVAETLRKAGWSTASVNHFMLQGRGATVHVAPGYDDSDKTTDVVIDLLQKRRANFIAVTFGATDQAGHRHGPRSEEVKRAVLDIDRNVGRLMDALRTLGILEETLITFNSDHGMSAFESRQVSLSPTQALVDAGFRVATSDAQLARDTQIVVLDYGVRIVYFRNVTAGEREKATRILRAIEGAEVLDRARLDALGCHDNRSGDLIVSPLAGYTISNAGGKGGLHGRFAEQNPILFFRGPGIKRSSTVPAARTIDIVPTLLRVVNVPPAASVDGRAIEGALE